MRLGTFEDYEPDTSFLSGLARGDAFNRRAELIAGVREYERIPRTAIEGPPRINFSDRWKAEREREVRPPGLCWLCFYR